LSAGQCGMTYIRHQRSKPSFNLPFDYTVFWAHGVERALSAHFSLWNRSMHRFMSTEVTRTRIPYNQHWL
jgi:hypothetical protein